MVSVYKKTRERKRFDEPGEFPIEGREKEIMTRGAKSEADEQTERGMTAVLKGPDRGRKGREFLGWRMQSHAAREDK